MGELADRPRPGVRGQGFAGCSAVDTIGLPLTVLITAAGVQDRDGARPLLWNLRKASKALRPAAPGDQLPEPPTPPGASPTGSKSPSPPHPARRGGRPSHETTLDLSQLA
jgi:hypothetical protein